MARSHCQHKYRSSVLQACTAISGTATGISHALFSNKYELTIPSGMLFILSGILWYFFEVDFDSLKQVIFTFRGFMICWFLLTIVSCNMAYYIVHEPSLLKPWIITIFNACTWSTGIAIVLSFDCAQNVTNYMRLVAPLFAVLNALYILAFDNEEELALFTFHDGSITLTQIKSSAYIELILFLFTLIFSVIFDYHHQYYTILTDAVRRKLILPLRGYATEYTEFQCFCGFKLRFKTHWFYRMMLLLAVLGVIQFVVDYFSEYENAIGNVMITSLCMVLTILFFMKYLSFDWKIWALLLGNFRSMLLVISICIRLYAPIQEAFWHFSYGPVANTICYAAMYVFGAIWLWTRDAMLITYPRAFTLILGTLVFAISWFNVMNLQFYDSYPYPKWFLYATKASYLQIMMFAALTLKSVVCDPEFKYCVLIRYSKPRDLRKASRKVELSKAPRDLRYALTGDSRLLYHETSTVESTVIMGSGGKHLATPRSNVLHVPQESLTEMSQFIIAEETSPEAPKSITWAPILIHEEETLSAV